MRKLFSNVGAFAIGIVSFAVTLGLVLGLEKAIDLDLFSLMWWGVIPAGAFVTGILAASGYYFGAVALHVKPNKAVAIALLGAAALFQAAIYYVPYSLARTEDGQAISSLIGFPRFVGWMLTHAKYGIIIHGYRPGGADGGLEVGVLGYVVAGVQFLALVAGSLGVYVMLGEKPYCDPCAKYLKSKAKLQVPFAGDINTVNQLRQVDALSNEYFASLGSLPEGSSAALELALLHCPSCGKEALEERPMFIKEGKLAYEGGAYRTIWSAQKESLEARLVPFPVASSAAGSAEPPRPHAG